jgi:hypothetical protein
MRLSITPENLAQWLSFAGKRSQAGFALVSLIALH